MCHMPVELQQHKIWQIDKLSVGKSAQIFESKNTPLQVKVHSSAVHSEYLAYSCKSTKVLHTKYSKQSYSTHYAKSLFFTLI